MLDLKKINMKNNRCIILGGGGFIGSHLTEALTNKGYHITVFSTKSNKAIKNLGKVFNKVTFKEGNLHNTNLLTKMIKKGDIIFDLISSSVPASSAASPLEEIRNNVLSHIQFFKSACEKKVAKIIFLSSGGGVYGKTKRLPISENELPQPISPHSISKMTVEYYLHYFSKIYHIPYLVYRISNVYGPRQIPKTGFAIIPTLLSAAIQQQRPVLFDHGKLSRDFIYIDDVISAILLSFNKKNREHVYNVGTGTKTNLKNLWNTILKITHTKTRPIYKPKRSFDVTQNVLDISLFSHEFHWKPKTSLSIGLRKTWEWVQNEK